MQTPRVKVRWLAKYRDPISGNEHEVGEESEVSAAIAHGLVQQGVVEVIR